MILNNAENIMYDNHEVQKLYYGKYLVWQRYEWKSFSECTDEEVVIMLNAHYNGIINISDYWSVGECRTIHIDTVYGNDQVEINDSIEGAYQAQDMPIRIIGIEQDNLYQSINGHTKAAITVECVYSLGSSGVYIMGKPSYSMADQTVWGNNPLRVWLNNELKNSLPNYIKDNIKPVLKDNYDARIDENFIITIDNVFLTSVDEVYYSQKNSTYQFYEVATNRTITDYYNNSRETRAYRWTRTPIIGRSFIDYVEYIYTLYWGLIYKDDGSSLNGFSAVEGIAPAFAM